MSTCSHASSKLAKPRRALGSKYVEDWLAQKDSSPEAAVKGVDERFTDQKSAQGTAGDKNPAHGKAGMCVVEESSDSVAQSRVRWYVETAWVPSAARR